MKEMWFVDCSCIYEARMSPALNGSSAIWRFEHSDAIEICNRIIFDFYTGLPHMVVIGLISIGGPGSAQSCVVAAAVVLSS